MGSVADLIVQHLRDAGVVTLFGVPGGGSNLDLIEAAGRAGLPFVLTTTETGAAIAAVAQSELTGRPGACLTALGPGVTSVVNGVACAFLDRAQLLVLTDAHPSGASAFEHQRIDHAALLAPVTKWSATLSAENADAVVREAIERAMAGPPGPVHIDVPSDVAGLKSLEPGPSRGSERPALQAGAVERLPFTDVRRPLLLIGLGARRPGEVAAIRAFCHTHRVPAMVTYKAKGVLPDDDPHFAGVFMNAAMDQSILQQADLFIAVGLDPVELLPRPWVHRQPIVSIVPWRVDDRHMPFSAQHVGSIADGLAAIGESVGNVEWNLDAVRLEVDAQRKSLQTVSETLTPVGVVRAAVRASAGARVTVDAGAHMFPATVLWPAAEPGDLLISNGLSTMGFALPAAIGAALVDRTKPVIALTGDGGLLLCAGELLTAAREQLRVVIIVFNDASLSLIAVKQQQRQLAPAGVALGDVAWCALAESLGIPSRLVTSEREVERELREALGRAGPTLLEARVEAGSYAAIIRAVRG